MPNYKHIVNKYKERKKKKEDMRLSKVEFAILKFLLERHPNPSSLSEIIAHLTKEGHDIKTEFELRQIIEGMPAVAKKGIRLG